MNANSFLFELCPRWFRRCRILPLFGPHVDDFIRWLYKQSYADASVRNYLYALPQLVRWLQRKRVGSLEQLSQRQLREAYNYYRSRDSNVSCAVRCLIRFFGERGTVLEAEALLPSPTAVELSHFAGYLRDIRGLVMSTVVAHISRL